MPDAFLKYACSFSGGIVSTDCCCHRRLPCIRKGDRDQCRKLTISVKSPFSSGSALPWSKTCVSITPIGNLAETL